MKNKILTIAIISMAILTSCNKGGSMASLETTIAEQKISSVNSTDSSFLVDVPLKSKDGKDFIIEKSGELRLNSINVINKKKTNSASDVENEKPIFQVKVEEGADYVDIPNDGLLITKKSSDGSYKFDVKLKSGNLKEGESIDFSFSVKKSADSEVMEFKKKMTTQNSISAKKEIATETPKVQTAGGTVSESSVLPKETEKNPEVSAKTEEEKSGGAGVIVSGEAEKSLENVKAVTIEGKTGSHREVSSLDWRFQI